jgi:hypothetical protein
VTWEKIERDQRKEKRVRVNVFGWKRGEKVKQVCEYCLSKGPARDAM